MTPTPAAKAKLLRELKNVQYNAQNDGLKQRAKEWLYENLDQIIRALTSGAAGERLSGWKKVVPNADPVEMGYFAWLDDDPEDLEPIICVWPPMQKYRKCFERGWYFPLPDLRGMEFMNLVKEVISTATAPKHADNSERAKKFDDLPYALAENGWFKRADDVLQKILFICRDKQNPKRIEEIESICKLEAALPPRPVEQIEGLPEAIEAAHEYLHGKDKHVYSWVQHGKILKAARLYQGLLTPAPRQPEQARGDE